MGPAVLPNVPLQLAANGLGEPGVALKEHQLDAIEAPLFEVRDEFTPEGLGFGVHVNAAQLDAQRLPRPSSFTPKEHDDNRKQRLKNESKTQGNACKR